MKLNICDESHNSSSSDDDHVPMLPPTSSSSSTGSLSPIEEEKTVSSESTSTEESKYLSSFCNSSLSSLTSDDSEFNRYKDILLKKEAKVEEMMRRNDNGATSTHSESTGRSMEDLVLNIGSAAPNNNRQSYESMSVTVPLQNSIIHFPDPPSYVS